MIYLVSLPVFASMFLRPDLALFTQTVLEITEFSGSDASVYVRITSFILNVGSVATFEIIAYHFFLNVTLF